MPPIASRRVYQKSDAPSFFVLPVLLYSYALGGCLGSPRRRASPLRRREEDSYSIQKFLHFVFETTLEFAFLHDFRDFSESDASRQSGKSLSTFILNFRLRDRPTQPQLYDIMQFETDCKQSVANESLSAFQWQSRGPDLCLSNLLLWSQRHCIFQNMQCVYDPEKLLNFMSVCTFKQPTHFTERTVRIIHMMSYR